MFNVSPTTYRQRKTVPKIKVYNLGEDIPSDPPTLDYQSGYDQAQADMKAELEHQKQDIPKEQLQRAVEHCDLVLEQIMEEVQLDLPKAVDAVFHEVCAARKSKDFDGCTEKGISQREWLTMWRSYPELLYLMTYEGMLHMVAWASCVSQDQ